jgi:hypothetical protein
MIIDQAHPYVVLFLIYSSRTPIMVRVSRMIRITIHTKTAPKRKIRNTTAPISSTGTENTRSRGERMYPNRKMRIKLLSKLQRERISPPINALRKRKANTALTNMVRIARNARK